MIENGNINVESRYDEIKRFILDDYKNDPTILGIDGLLDVLLVLHDECSNATLRGEKSIKTYLENVKTFVSRIKQCRLNRNDFEIIKTIGQGAFGEVVAVKMKNTERIFAMKIMNKMEILNRADIVSFREERDVLVLGDPQWITKLYYAFQDNENLYLLMEYYYGGDLLTLLSTYDDKFSEDMTRFYVAEIILAVDSLHRLGHIRLADFGSCLRMRADGTVQSNVSVGTPDYISPEVLCAMNENESCYGSLCDWWSLGCVMWEMLFGSPPFYAEAMLDTYGQIIARSKNKIPLSFPGDVDVSDDAKDLLQKLLCSADYRLGKNGLNDFKKHPFFTKFDWNNLRQIQPPYIPVVIDTMDILNSNDIEPETFVKTYNTPASKMGLPDKVLFIGFTYSGDSHSSNSIKTIQASPVPLNKSTITLKSESKIINSAIRPSSTSSGNLIFSTNAVRQVTEGEHESKIKLLELERTSLVHELNRFHQLYNEIKNDSVKKTREIQELRDFYTDQYEISRHEQIEYLTRILSLFQDLPESNGIKHFHKHNVSSLSMEEQIRNDLDQKLSFFLTNYKSLLMKDSKDKTKSVSNDVSLLLSKFQDKFSRLLINNGNDGMVLTNETNNLNDPLLKNIISFFNDVYQQMKKILHDKKELNDQFISLAKKQRKYINFQSNICKAINEGLDSNSYLKKLVNQMAQEFDQKQELTNPQLVFNSRTSSISSSTGNNPSRALSHSVKLQHMEIQQLQIAVEREIQVRQQVEKKLKELEKEIVHKVEELVQLKQENQLIKKQLDDEQAKHLSKRTISEDKSLVIDNDNNNNNNTSTDHNVRSVPSDPFIPQTPATKANNNQRLDPLQNAFHDFRLNNFYSPCVCHHCLNALIGIVRQGFTCKRCGIVCHSDCVQKVQIACEPSIKDQNQANLGVPYIVQIPKSGGIRKGWNQCQILLFHSKLLFYELSNNTKISDSEPFLIIDVTDDKFNVCSVTPEDVMHAKKKDIPNIFKITVNKLSSPKILKNLYVLTNNESERDQYINMLSNLSMKLNTHIRNGVIQCGTFITKEIFDISLKKVTGARILDPNRFLIFGEDGLYLLDVFDNKPTRLHDRKIYDLALVSNNELLIMLSGKECMIRIKSLQCLLARSPPSLDSEIPETKNATLFTTNSISLTLCVAVKNRILCYKLHSKPQQYPYTLIHELNTVQSVSYLELSILKVNKNEEEILWYGDSSTCMAQKVAHQSPSVVLLRDTDRTLEMFRKLPIVILRVIPVTNSSSINELLLVYHKLGIYVNYSTGMRTRHRELMWSSLPISTSYTDPYLLVYTKVSVDIYDVSLGTWLQSLSLSNTYPLTLDGSISLSYDQELIKDHGKLIYIASLNRLTRSLHIAEKYSSPLISDPVNFQHLEHVERDEGLKLLSRPACDRKRNRIKSMIETESCNSSDSNRLLINTSASRSILNTSVPLGHSLIHSSHLFKDQKQKQMISNDNSSHSLGCNDEENPYAVLE
ncbi:unnamed protein product [Rotaria socialis]|uniref:non-specific serine/threonine protein kinase n=1 Tax=Rotaria socialis TaxID=392032 RepID=A0A818G1J5_9BILA|nr:unnamed protein product [Rotaria socialis]